MKKKLIYGLLTAFIFTLMSTTGFAAKLNYSFNVNPSVNGGVAWSYGNPKDDNEQAAYIYTTSHNIVDSDVFYYNVRVDASLDAPSKTGYFRVTPSNAARIVKSYSGPMVVKDQILNLQADTDKYNVYAAGYWYS